MEKDKELAYCVSMKKTHIVLRIESARIETRHDCIRTKFIAQWKGTGGKKLGKRAGGIAGVK